MVNVGEQNKNIKNSLIVRCKRHRMLAVDAKQWAINRPCLLQLLRNEASLLKSSQVFIGSCLIKLGLFWEVVQTRHINSSSERKGWAGLQGLSVSFW